MTSAVKSIEMLILKLKTLELHTNYLFYNLLMTWKVNKIFQLLPRWHPEM